MDMTYRKKLGTRALFIALFLLSFQKTAPGQDIRGFETCTAEKDMARRTGCLQSNASFLHELLTKETRRAQAVEAAAARDIAGLKADLAALKLALDRAQTELAELKKSKPADAPAKK